MTGFCEAIVSWLPTLRKSAESVPVMTWEAFVDEARAQVNPLASSDHFQMLFTQLEQMGEVNITLERNCFVNFLGFVCQTSGIVSSQ